MGSSCSDWERWRFIFKMWNFSILFMPSLCSLNVVYCLNWGITYLFGCDFYTFVCAAPWLLHRCSAFMSPAMYRGSQICCDYKDPRQKSHRNCVQSMQWHCEGKLHPWFCKPVIFFLLSYPPIQLYFLILLQSSPISLKINYFLCKYPRVRNNLTGIEPV